MSLTAVVTPEKQSLSERSLLLVLAAVQFTTVVDFLIIMPLGPQYMRVFHITPGQFGLIVSSYAISAGITGLAAGLVLDRFDRKRAMLALYAGFTVGTFCCALAPGYHWLVAARALAGAFGGLVGALILSIVGDVVPDERRGAAMGVIMSSFSVASICGVPLGLVVASHFSWHVPFLALAILSAGILVAAAKIVPPLRGHMRHATGQHPARKMLEVLSHTPHQMAFLFMGVLTCAGFLVFPYISNYLVANVGVTEQQLPLMYLAGGMTTIFSMNIIGRWADRVGKHRVFAIMSACACVPILGLTNLPHVPLVAALTVTTLLFIGMSGRMVPAMALITGSIEARYRGGFMSINSAMQQFAAGVAAFVSGHIMGQAASGELTRYPLIGVISASLTITCIYLGRFLRPVIDDSTVEEQLVLECPQV